MSIGSTSCLTFGSGWTELKVEAAVPMGAGGVGWATTLAKEEGPGGAGTVDSVGADWEGGAAVGKRAGPAWVRCWAGEGVACTSLC